MRLLVNKTGTKRSLVLIIMAVFGIFACTGSQETITSRYPYETVPGDPLNARIYTLDNGLKIYTTVYKNEPRIQTAIAVKAGGKTDPDDATGMAHYLEHMLFKGTDEYGTSDWVKEKAEIDKIIELYDQYGQTTDTLARQMIYHKIDSVSQVASQYAIANEYDKMLSYIGARGTNAFTSNEQTVYINDIPANQFERWLEVEFERFSDPVMRLFHTELEVVYEEKNRALDSDGRKVRVALNKGLFPTHPYGTHTVLGTVEHLKNPPLRKVIEYFKTYYVPNNMAICLSGDFDPDEVVPRLAATFGTMPAKPVPDFLPPQEKPITGPVVKEVVGPEAESVMLAYRFPGSSSREADLLVMTDMILMNRQAGLIDINLNQQQKVLGAYSYPSRMNDYSYHGLGGRPRAGQSLEEVKNLLLEQIELIKTGDFPEWLPAAVITDMKLSRIRARESNWGRAYSLVQSFTSNSPWERTVSEMDRLAAITKQDIIDFANQHYADNYVVVYKRTGQDENVLHIAKPPITPVQVNRTDQSQFYTDLKTIEIPDVEPVFLDFDADVNRLELKDGLPLLYAENSENELFSLYYQFEMGNDHNPVLGIALHYLSYLGTSQYSPEQLKQEFYKLGCEYSVSTGRDRVWVRLHGLNDNFEPALKLFEHLLDDAQPQPQALANLNDDIKKQRRDNKLSKRQIKRALANYAKYGPESSFTNVLDSDQLDVLSASELVQLIAGLTEFEHRVIYYGPLSKDAARTTLTNLHPVPDELKAIPAGKEFIEQDISTNGVFIVNYDMVQAEIQMLAKSIRYNPDNLPVRALFNEYYGGNMSSVIFQTMRESKALAYSVYARYGTPRRPDQSHYITAYIGTQADKVPEAMAGFFELLNTMPRSDKALHSAKDGIINRIKPERITRADVIFRYLSARRMGLDHDTRRDLYHQVPELTFDDINAFFEDYITGQSYNIMIVGDIEQIDQEGLRQYGEISQLTLEEIFGY